MTNPQGINFSYGNLSINVVRAPEVLLPGILPEGYDQQVQLVPQFCTIITKCTIVSQALATRACAENFFFNERAIRILLEQMDATLRQVQEIDSGRPGFCLQLEARTNEQFDSLTTTVRDLSERHR
jgi:hypothetical protein